MTEEEIGKLLSAVALHADKGSFKKLYFYYYARLKRLSESIVRSSELAEEVVDDVFLKLWTSRLTLPRINNLSVYLYVLVKNNSINSLARSNKVITVDIDRLEIQLKDYAASAEQKLMLDDLTATINSAINSLSPQCNTVYKLVKEDGLKYKEVAEILNISVKTVEYHVGNALKRIAHSISESDKPHLIGSFKKIFIN